jgi:hypothetical protein
VDKTARIWDAATAKEIAVLRGHNHQVSAAGADEPKWRATTPGIAPSAGNQ